MKVGSFVKVAYKGMTEDGRVFDENDGITIIVGAGHVIKGLDKVLKEMEVGEEREVLIDPEEAFGKRDPKKVKFYSAGVFLRQGIRPQPNMLVEINGKKATIVSVNGGRVLVDFNHPLAGKKVRYWIKVIEEVKEPQEKVLGLLTFHLGELAKDVGIEVEGNKVKILNLPEFAKSRIKEELENYANLKVIFIEGGEKHEHGKHDKGGSGEGTAGRA